MTMDGCSLKLSKSEFIDACEKAIKLMDPDGKKALLSISKQPNNHTIDLSFSPSSQRSFRNIIYNSVHDKNNIKSKPFPTKTMDAREKC
jgi:hypothetical protein